MFRDLWNSIKKLIFNKRFLIVLGAIILIYAVLFPHTTTTRVNSDFTGVYTTQKETYFLHSLSSFTVENVCTPTTVVKSTTTSYRLNGNIKAIETTNCNGTYANVYYNSNGSRDKTNGITFVGTSIQTNSQDFNSNGLLTENRTEINGVVTLTLNEYYNGVDLKTVVQTVTSYGEKTAESIKNYDKDGNMTSSDIKAWNNDGDLIGEASESYTDGNIAGITYSDEELNFNATVTCDSSGCVVSSFSGDGFTVTYNTTTSSYELLIQGESNPRNLGVGFINEFNYGSVLEDIDEDAKAVIETVNSGN